MLPACEASRTTRWLGERCSATSSRARVTRLDVCDAHPELVRAATYLGTELSDACPVCDKCRMREVTYVYGDKLKQANGRCVANEHELARLGRNYDEFACYDVEVCVDCGWNHLRRQWLHGRLHAS